MGSGRPGHPWSGRQTHRYLARSSLPRLGQTDTLPRWLTSNVVNTHCISRRCIVHRMVDDGIAVRLRTARQRAGYAGPTEAARRFNWPLPTYLSHENGTRGLTIAALKRYARAFRVSAGWLLDGADMGRPRIGSDETRTAHERLRNARIAAGHATAKAAAAARGWNVSTFHAHENGSRAFSWERAVVYAAALNVSPEWLMGGSTSLTEQQRRALDALDLYPADDRETVIRLIVAGAPPSPRRGLS